MAYVITQACCNDASCVSACPVNCIHPTPEEREFAQTEMLHIDPETCIDCGACVDACPVDAIFPEDKLIGSLTRYKDINAEYYTTNPMPTGWIPLTPATPPRRDLGKLRVAVVAPAPRPATRRVNCSNVRTSRSRCSRSSRPRGDSSAPVSHPTIRAPRR